MVVAVQAVVVAATLYSNMTPEFRELRYFMVVAEEGSLTQAAARLHVTQQALSQAMQQLERRVRVELLERTARGVRLTVAGDLLVEHAGRVLREVADLDRALQHVRADAEGSLRIGLLVDGAGPLTAPILSAFRAAYPKVQLAVSRLGPHNAVDGLFDSTVDVALLHGPFDRARLQVVELFSEPRVVVLSAADERADAAELAVDDLLDSQVLTRSDNVPAEWEGFFTLVPERNGEQPERVAPAAGSLEEVLWNIGVHEAVLTLPRHFVDTYPTTTFGVRYVDAPNLAPVTFFLAWPRVAPHPLAKRTGQDRLDRRPLCDQRRGTPRSGDPVCRHRPGDVRSGVGHHAVGCTAVPSPAGDGGTDALLAAR